MILHAPIGYSLQGEELLELNGHRKWLRRGRPSCDGCRVDEVLSQVLRSERLLHVASTIKRLWESDLDAWLMRDLTERVLDAARPAALSDRTPPPDFHYQ